LALHVVSIVSDEMMVCEGGREPLFAHSYLPSLRPTSNLALHPFIRSVTSRAPNLWHDLSHFAVERYSSSHFL
jgi:hypothetical protein